MFKVLDKFVTDQVTVAATISLLFVTSKKPVGSAQNFQMGTASFVLGLRRTRLDRPSHINIMSTSAYLFLHKLSFSVHKARRKRLARCVYRKSQFTFFSVI